MVHIDAQALTRSEQEALVSWVREQELDPQEIAGDRFSVHEGRISGHKYLFTSDGNPVVRGDRVVRVPFNVAQTTPLPKELQNA